MLIYWDNWSPLDHQLVWVEQIIGCLVSVYQRDNILTKHIRTGGLVGLKILVDDSKGLLGVCSIPLGSILAVEVVVVISFPPTLEV